ncbi:MAG: hypothetical protein WA982_10985 [Rubrobacteraceae bacterium]
MRILVTVQPQMYRETLALALQRYRPDAEVLLHPLESPDGELERFGPHLLVRNDNTDGTNLLALVGEELLCWVEILYSDGMDAMIHLDGEVRQIKNISMSDLLTLVDEVENLIPA